jgi:hypothetical protein
MNIRRLLAFIFVLVFASLSLGIDQGMCGKAQTKDAAPIQSSDKVTNLNDAQDQAAAARAAEGQRRSLTNKQRRAAAARNAARLAAAEQNVNGGQAE